MIETETRFPGAPLGKPNSIIYKFTLQLGKNTLKIPYGAQVLTAQFQRDAICLWVLAGEDEFKSAKESESDTGRTFYVSGTGHPLPHQIGCYISTVQAYSFVWHIFEGI